MKRGRMKSMTSVKESTRMGRPRELEQPKRTFLNIEQRIIDAVQKRARQEGCSRSRIISRILCGDAEPLKNVG